MGVVFWLSVLVGLTPADPTRCGGVVSEPGPPAWCADRSLQSAVSLSVAGRPLRSALAGLGVAGVRFECDDALADQRVAMFAKDVPAWKVMLRLVDAFSHGEIPGRHVEWVLTEKDGRAVYRLVRTSAGASALRSDLQKPGRQAVEWLMALCRYATGAPRPNDDTCPVVRDLARSGIPAEVGPLLQALSVANESELTALVEQGETDVGAGRTATPRRLRASRGPMPGMFDVTLVTQDGRDRQEEVGFVFDTLGIGPPDASVCEEELRRDLTSGARVTLRDPSDPEAKMPETSLAEALTAWAFSTGRTVVAEVFLRNRIVLPISAGAPDELLTAICRAFSCDWRKVGDVYVVWSMTWAFDAQADVPESRIASWRTDLEEGRERGLRAVVAMSRLSDPQIAVVEGATGATRLATPSVLRACRLLAALPGDVLNSAKKRRIRLWRPAPVMVSRAADVLGGPALEPLDLRLRPEPDGSAYLLELTSGGLEVPAAVRIPTRCVRVRPSPERK